MKEDKDVPFCMIVVKFKKNGKAVPPITIHKITSDILGTLGTYLLKMGVMKSKYMKVWWLKFPGMLQHVSW